MTARAFLADHTKKEKETARKRGPSLQKKTKQLGEIARIRTLTLYEDPTHGVWHVAMHCPTGKSFPDLTALVNEFSKGGEPPKVRDVGGCRPGRAAIISRKTNNPGRHRRARNAADIPQSIYDVPDDDGGEILCSASITCTSPSREASLDEYTVAEAVTVGEANTVGEADTVGETNMSGEINMIGETDAVGETDYTVGMEHTTIWAEEMAGMEDTVAWEADAGTGVEGWDVGGLETENPDLAWDTSTAPEVASHPLQQNNTKHYETQQGELSRKWAWYALMEALAQQRRLYFSLW
ncbi:hypothetical protein BBAD15_g12389 [Beauveria bassiana D1-5]|uniref:Uncharacterized protein n=1 Tax=Beauveria bassiana D1-5 TaxID=1245745 RepID=A0A0A2V3N0_BEABA|nr:hypothetical protein BBAD15_g12389 [Beauveria bassiana D1-5]